LTDIRGNVVLEFDPVDELLNIHFFNTK
jgi:hypothetical protein